MSRTIESALTALTLEYADAVRLRDADRWAATWTEDGRWVLGEGREVVGRDAIVQMWTTSMAKYDRVVQLYFACTFDVEGVTVGATASGRCEFQELNVVTDGSRKLLAGHYRDTYRLTAAGWRFTSRELTRYYQGPPDLMGEFL